MTTAEFRARTTGHLFMVLVAMAVGLCGAVGAVVFRLLIRLVQATAFEGIDGLERLYDEGLLAEATDPLAAARALEWYWRLVIPAFGGLIIGPLIYFFAREAKGHGVPEVMAAVALRGGVIRKRIVAVKALASAICIGSGGSVGREGIVRLGQHAFVEQPLEALDALEGDRLEEPDQEAEGDGPDGAAQTHGHGHQHHEEVAGRPGPELGGRHGIDGGLLAATAS